MGCITSKRQLRELSDRVAFLEMENDRLVSEQKERDFKESLRQTEDCSERRRKALEWHREQYLKTHPDCKNGAAYEGGNDEID